MSPPQRESRPGGYSETASKTHHPRQRDQVHIHDKSLAWVERRRDAAARSVPINCGCRDPWICRCWDDPEPSMRLVDGYRDAALHLQYLGLTPAPMLPEMRTMWRRGDDDRRLVSVIAERWGLVA